MTGEDEKFHLTQWLFFQASGQGPYYGQAAWFIYFHAEKIPSAIERYTNEILRVLGVLESVLSKQEWLVGGKLTIADLSFITYDSLSNGFAQKANFFLRRWNQGALAGPLPNKEGFNFQKDFPAVSA